jgi:hypothetical protein
VICHYSALSLLNIIQKKESEVECNLEIKGLLLELVIHPASIIHVLTTVNNNNNNNNNSRIRHNDHTNHTSVGRRTSFVKKKKKEKGKQQNMEGVLRCTQCTEIVKFCSPPF